MRLNSPVTWDKSEPQLPICEMGTETLLTFLQAAGKTEIRQEKHCKQNQVHKAFCDCYRPNVPQRAIKTTASNAIPSEGAPWATISFFPWCNLDHLDSRPVREEDTRKAQGGLSALKGRNGGWKEDLWGVEDEAKTRNGNEHPWKRLLG